MRCDYYDSGRCRSCTLIETPHAVQVADKQAGLERLVAQGAPGARPEWLPPLLSAESGFRTKAKMVVAGSVDAPTIGILDPAGRGVDLRGCPLYPEPLSASFPVLAELITRARLEPYDVPERRGELKHVIVTLAPSGDLMVRFVMRSTEAHARLVKHLPWLRERLPALAVATLNVLPEHKAVTEGEREIVLTERASLTMELGAVALHLRPQSFFQTNTAIARDLYAQVAGWVDESAPATVWDLYCGVGGFALHCVREGRRVTGVEASEQAVASARLSAAEMDDAGVAGADGATFVVGDAVAWATSQPAVADVVVVNPPRRGIGVELAAWLEASGVSRVVYSSCNAVTLARDLAAMPSLVPVRGRLLDMFPHTTHYEAVVLLQRR
ncbi:23S rRNA (uracil(747)-C(5))-methyltransferase RlmC [Demequina sp. SYSU T00039]|uniref:23S rRNA (Uracil(747)-C(5))-methyltransferase RlmC n=1 Tax=Demequina lignilytica TaxID=3051663 RepID=A0AAW7M563_9MICO|nr:MULTISPECIES: 23S rRNA (uracil(747)-C(5))-methyltransferase RlmC [unclassified Demequina]MDN4477616.1 23S rRNA (uracil(747)-C(5))-methyltransferase RlmC [Demequina sp. SYSU T00039-1]MDN4488033.1 23S rRNA (uracil(747)-C(5))-methyltransferase RlmC [Demequina sp. SYSU T00039]MDN4490473.1 23S rRNA (uracil(747)-C(5))-methyltransferase RlmC [Demequina sp. SYSU T00068]